MAALLGRARDDHRQQFAQPAAALFGFGLVVLDFDVSFGLLLDLRFRFGFARCEDIVHRRLRYRRGELCRSRRGQFGYFDIEIEFRGDAAENRGRFGHPPGTEFPAGHRAFVGIHHRDARLPQPVSIALGRVVFPHLHIHRRNGQHRLVGSEDQRSRQIVGNARRHFRQHIGGGGAYDHQVGLAAELDMAHLDLVLEIEQRGIDLVLAQRGERHRGDELLAAFGQHTGHLAARLADQADKLARLVGRDAPADDEQNPRTAHAVRPAA